MAGDVFISHASEDASVTAQVCALLEGRGLRCWMAPRDVPGGAVWDEAILDAIEGSRVFLLILSGKANQSQFVKNEVNRAFSQNKPIVTFRLEEVAPGRSLELYLARHHWTDGFLPPLGARVETLAGSLTVLLNGAAAPSVAGTGAPSTANVGASTKMARPALGRRLLVTAFHGGWKGRRVAVFVAAVMALITLTAAATWILKPTPAPPAPVTRSVFLLPAGESLQGDLPSIALSPDGKYLVYAARTGTSQQLYLHSMDSFDARPIPDTQGGSAPFFSPDSQSIGFFADSQLKKVSINGGRSIAICPAPVGILASGTWGTDGNIAFQDVAFGGLWEVPATGGTQKALNTLEKGELTNRWPVFVGGARAIAFVAADRTQFLTAQLVIYELGSHQRQMLGSGTGPSYVPTGHVLYVQGGTLTAEPFDLEKMKVAGAPMPIVEGVLQPSDGAPQYSLSQNGTLAYVAGGLEDTQNLLVWVDRKGQEQTLPLPAHHYRNPRISPDGKYIAMVLDDQGGDVWLYDTSRNILTRLTFESGLSTNVEWTPDGKRVIFNVGVPKALYSQPADGSGKADRLAVSDDVLVPGSVAPDGKVIAYYTLDPKTSWDVWTLGLSDGHSQPFLRTPAYESSPEFSPDGRWLAYVSDESGRFEVYVQPYPGPGRKWQISTEGGTEPTWNSNGREIFYRHGPEMMAVDIGTQTNFTAGRPKKLFEAPYQSLAATSPSYSVSPDGQRFLMLKPRQPQESLTRINIVQNWFEELKQKVPTGKK